ncbi:UPF0187-domain-containing protein [Patellaria atrata CBS 101060]|uniref:UPF0187-domain-containing protein n=1 Tax=Patellaria atrata CBS 101060 TaxID=1346257 RepID=A0A9P4VPT7_9PEZI|nr:UPF0187-domain-containing protein [Patellaria atrata CBS 101060]
MSPLAMRPGARKRKNTNKSIDLDNYFTGPAETDHHSKWPHFFRLHGSILPEMILPLLFIGGWATCITCISEFVYPLRVASILLTVLGFVVGLALSFRSSTAYERYAEGRKYWAQLTLTSHQLARTIWVHTTERDGELGKQDILAKRSALNLIVAFAVALKHKLRFQPFTEYDDLHGLVGHLDTFAKEASDQKLPANKSKSTFKVVGEYLGLPMAESNPRKAIKRSKKPLGNLPLEVLSHLSAYVDSSIANGSLGVSIYQTHALNAVSALNDVLVGTDRVLNTPLPVAYSIAISQITWVYVLMLPFQLYDALRWVTIPGTIFAAYIILGIALIGREIENPFGMDVNDLNLDYFCDQLAQEIDVISSNPAPKPAEFVMHKNNMVMFPLGESGYQSWEQRSLEQIRTALKAKANMTFQERKSEHVQREKVGEV